MLQRIAVVLGLLLCSFGAFGAQDGQKFVDYRKLKVGIMVRIPVQLLSERGRAALLPPEPAKTKIYTTSLPKG